MLSTASKPVLTRATLACSRQLAPVSSDTLIIRVALAKGTASAATRDSQQDPANFHFLQPHANRELLPTIKMHGLNILASSLPATLLRGHPVGTGLAKVPGCLGKVLAMPLYSYYE